MAMSFCATQAHAQEDDTPALAPPVLEEFVEAPYPQQARASGEAAEVVLELDIDDSGAVTEARVVESGGGAFDEAALRAAKQFRFRPARRDGQPVASRIRYRYQFALEPEPALEPALTFSEISGAVRFAGDTPLVGAEVRVIAQDGETKVTTSGPGGRFRVGDLAPGRYRVRVEADGFRTYVVAETVTADTAVEVIYRLVVARGLSEVVIEGDRPVEQQPAREVTRRRLSRKEISRVPGTGGDALKSLQSLPGVARPPAIAGLLIVRGSAPANTGVFIDQSQVPLIYHFGGLASVVPTEMIETIDFYPSNFGVRYGRLTGGIVDVALRPPNTTCLSHGEPTGEDDCFHGMAQLDLLDARLMASGPLGDDWSFAIAARRSWVDAWIGAVLNSDGTSVTAAPVYYDYQAIVDYRPSKDDRLSLRVFGSDDGVELFFDEPPANNPGLGGQLDLGTRFVRAQALYETKLADDVWLNGMLAAGYEHTGFSLGNNLSFEFDNVPLEYRGEIGWRIAPWVRVNAGVDYLLTHVDGKVRAPDPLRPGEQDPGTLVSVNALEANPRRWLHRPAWYGELELKPFDRWKIVPGVRMDYTRTTSSGNVSPRIYSRYNLLGPTLDESGPWRPRTTLKGGVGLYHQPPELQETNEVFGTPGISSTRATHYSLGLEQEISEQIEVSVEGFYKDLDNLVSRTPSADGSFDYNNEGEGRTFGGELLLKYKPDDLFFGWIAYSLARSVRRDAPGDEERLFQYDQTHNLTVLGSFQLPWGLEAGARFRLISGSPFTPLRDNPSAIYAADGTEYVPLIAAPFSDRLPTFHQLDLRIDKRWQFESWRLSAYLDVQNVYNNRAEESISYNYNFTQQRFQLGLPTLPSPGPTRRVLMRRLIVTSMCTLLLTACEEDNFERFSNVETVRVMAVRKDPAFARPGQSVELSMLWHDGRAAGEAVQLAWISGCVNPDGDLFYQCFAELGDALAGVGDASDPRVGLGESFTLPIPSDIISSRPPPPDPNQPPYGTSFVFFAACGGTLGPAPSGDIPIGCFNAGGVQLGADDFMIGYTTSFAYDALSNALPRVTGFRIAGREVAVGLHRRSMCRSGGRAVDRLRGRRRALHRGVRSRR